ncbi:MAG TPA: hypothetical protein VHA74_01900, partial [Candidatus Dojkabacteria bacterium]|nr:hypothetical protein [Candidatus Dojkabacteria bacterium]
NHAIQPKSKSKTEGDSSVRLKEKVNILEGYRKIYEVFYKRLTEEGISLDDEGIKVYSELDIKHRVNDNSVDTLLSKRLSIHFEQAIEGETPEDLRYLRLNVNIDIKKPELLNLKQLKIGMKSEDVKNVLNGYIPLPKN